MRVRDLAHIRTGDKGNLVNIAVISNNRNSYLILKEKLTENVVKSFYKEICLGSVFRYEVDCLESLNFVLNDIIGGGVTRSLSTDRHGKALGMALLELEI